MKNSLLMVGGCGGSIGSRIPYGIRLLKHFCFAWLCVGCVLFWLGLSFDVPRSNS